MLMKMLYGTSSEIESYLSDGFNMFTDNLRRFLDPTSPSPDELIDLKGYMSCHVYTTRLFYISTPLHHSV